MIKVNTRDHPWQEGMTVRGVIEEKKFTFRHLVVRVNGNFIPEDQYEHHVINDGDNVMVIHLIAGG